MSSKQPKLILRESCVHDMSASWVPDRFLEVGAGTGHMSELFLKRGFSGACWDLGSDNRILMKERFKEAGHRMWVVDDLTMLDSESFDYLFAFEVLEHIESDAEALDSWLRYLRPGGCVLVSVPAHVRKFGKSDEITGHVRRYEKQTLQQILAGAGLDEIRIVNYGFPITELTRRISNWIIRRDRSYENLTAEQRSIRSAIAKPDTINTVLSLVGERVFYPFREIQRWFYNLDLGDGYVATAVKRRI